MFCHKCGSRVPDDAEFCQRCGTKLVYEKIISDKFTAILTNIGDRKEDAIRKVMEWTGHSYDICVAMVEHVPVPLKIEVTREEAEKIKIDFLKIGARVNFTDKDGRNVNVVIHCKNCGKEYPEGSVTCRFCGNSHQESSIQKEIKVFLDKVLTLFRDKYNKFIASGIGRKILLSLFAILGLVVALYGVTLFADITLPLGESVIDTFFDSINRISDSEGNSTNSLPENSSESTFAWVEEPHIFVEYDWLTSRYITGVLQNISDTTFSYVNIKFALYDAYGNQIDTALDSIDNFKAGNTWRFKAAIPSDEVAYFEFVQVGKST